MSNFVEDLPHNLRMDLALYIYEGVTQQIKFLRDQSKGFVSWICPLLKPLVTTPSEFIYYEGDEVTKMYMLQEGSCDFVLPKFTNAKYLRVPAASHFGLIDIVSSCLQDENNTNDGGNEDPLEVIEDWQLKFLRRSFTVRSDDVELAKIMLLDKSDLFRMRLEFSEVYEELFCDAFQRLHFTMCIKLHAIERCSN